MKAARVHAKADANQAKLVMFMRQLGIGWQSTHSIPGALDGIMGYRGIDQRAEIKDPEQPPSKRKLTEAEQKVFDEWPGRKPIIIETEKDILDWVYKINQEIHNREFKIHE